MLESEKLIKNPRDWDDVDRAANAVFRCEPLPVGWAIITGTQLMQSVEHEKEREANRERKLAHSKQKEPVQNLFEAEP